MTKKIAIIHDSLTHFGGAERVLFALMEIFPNADIYTSLANKKLVKIALKKTRGKLKFSKLSNCSFALKNSSLFKPYFFHYYWESLNLDNYDLVISSSHSFCSHFVKVKNKHLCYMHTTPRFLHSEFNEIVWTKKPIIKNIVAPYFKILRKKNQRKIEKIDTLIVNSLNVQKRVKTYYNSESKVVYPPIKIAKKILTETKETKETKTYLFFSRLVKQKGIELVIEAFRENKKPLLVIGTSDQEKKWKKLASSNIKFLGFVEDKKLAKIFKEVKALIYASINEDFGMIPVEIMSHGIPIIAYKSGGVKESVINKKTGLFFENYDINSLNKALNKFEKINIKKQDCVDRAKKFNENKFKKELSALI